MVAPVQLMILEEGSSNCFSVFLADQYFQDCHKLHQFVPDSRLTHRYHSHEDTEEEAHDIQEVVDLIQFPNSLGLKV